MKIAFIVAVWIAVATLSAGQYPSGGGVAWAEEATGIRGEIVLPRDGLEWMSQQVEEPCILPNPKTPGRLIMFYSAVSKSNSAVAKLGKAWAEVGDPFLWHQDEANPFFGPSNDGWDSGSIRLDCVLYIPEEDAYYIYYSGTQSSIQDRIGLAICPAGEDGYSGVTSEATVRFGDAPVLAPEAAAPFHEEMASQAAVMREWNAADNRWDWYMYYSYRGKDGILPGIRLATSHDGKTWTRQFNEDDPRGMGQLFPSTPNAYYEWHQIFKTGSTYVLCIELGVEHGARWRPALAVSTDPTHGWSQLDPDTALQTTWPGLYDDRTLYHVATPALYEIEGKWYLYVQACGRPDSGNNIDGAWEMWCVACDKEIATRPGCADLFIPGGPMNVTVSSLRIALPPQAGPVMERCAAIAERQIACRSTVPIARSGPAAFTLTLDTDPALPPEGFEIADAPDGVRITGAEEGAIVYGLGKFLRTSCYTAEGFTPSAWRGTSAPQGSFRAIYAATHFNNFYESAPAEEVSRYLEDLALWGANTVIVTFPTWGFQGFDDPEARRNLEQTRRILRTAKAVGMKAGLVQCPNQGFASAPADTRAVPNPDPTGRRGNLGVNCCPSKPAGKAYLLDLYAKLFAEYKDIGLDYLLCWPYDEGGCGCEVCAPWGANAFPALSEGVAERGRAIYPGLRVILSTWVYDKPPEGEWEGLAARLEADHGWLNAIMCDDHLDFPRYPLDHGVPAGLPLYNFPEISMWGRNPWGSYGANPLPARYEALWKQTDGKLSGGMPYSEGIYEDMNKAICFQFYWNRDTAALDTLREYAAFEFSPDAAEDVIAAVEFLEAAWIERGPKSQQAFHLLQKIDGELPDWAKGAWRWRLLYLRGLIDSELVRHGEKLEGDRLRDAFNELTTLYHAENAHAATKPHRIP